MLPILEAPASLTARLAPLLPRFIGRGVSAVLVFSTRRPGEEPYWVSYLQVHGKRHVVGTPDHRHLPLNEQETVFVRLLQDFLSRPGDFEASGCQPSDAAVFAERAFSVYKQEFLVGISANDTALLGDVWLAAWRESQRVADPLRGLETAIDLLTKTERRHFDSVSRVLRGLPDHVQQRFWLGPKASCGGHAPLVALTAGEYKAVRRAAEAYAKR